MEELVGQSLGRFRIVSLLGDGQTSSTPSLAESMLA